MHAKAVVPAIVLSLALFAVVAFADTITLRSGEKISGRIAGGGQSSVVIQLDSGGVRIIGKSDVVPDASAQGARADAKGTPGRFPTLKETLKEMLNGLAMRVTRPGVIAEVSRDGTVYVDLGSADGVVVGDEFEIVRNAAEAIDPAGKMKAGASRDVAGRVRATDVQANLSACKLLSGTAEVKNSKGEYNLVLLPYKDTRYKASLGGLDVAENAGVTKERLFSALSEAAGGGASVELTQEAQAEAVLRIQASPAEGGVRIAASLSDIKTGLEISRIEIVHRTWYPASELGLMSAVSAGLGVPLNMAPVRKALEEAFGGVQEQSGVAYIPAAGAGGEPAWVFPDGTIVAGGWQELSSSKQATQLFATWIRTAQTAAGVVAAAPKSGYSAILRTKIQVYTVTPMQYQYIVQEAQVPDKQTLNWPDAVPTWATLSEQVDNEVEVYIDEQVRAAGNSCDLSSSLAGMQFGEHVVRQNRKWYSARVKWLSVGAFFPSPNGRIELLDVTNTPVGTSVFSKSLDSLLLPVPEGYVAAGPAAPSDPRPGKGPGDVETPGRDAPGGQDIDAKIRAAREAAAAAAAAAAKKDKESAAEKDARKTPKTAQEVFDEAIVPRTADGRIVRVEPGARLVTVNLGQNNGITSGMNLIVYSDDAVNGVVKRGMVEIVTVRSNISTARIVVEKKDARILEDNLVCKVAADGTR